MNRRHKIFAIIHLCIVFTYFSWQFLYPFLGEHFHKKSTRVALLSAMGNEELINEFGYLKEKDVNKLKRNEKRFQRLTENDKQFLFHQLHALEPSSSQKPLQKLQRIFYKLIYETPPPLQSWLLFSTLTALLVLLRVDGASSASWLLPLLALLFSWSNFYYGHLPSPSPTAPLYPTEEVLLSNYLQEPLSTNISEQQQQLEKAWNLFLVSQWAKQVPSNNPKRLKEQVEEGEYQFQLARLKQLSLEKKQPLTGHGRLSIFFLGLFLFWNLLFAWQVNKTSKTPIPTV